MVYSFCQYKVYATFAGIPRRGASNDSGCSTVRCQNVWNFMWCIHFPPHLICVATLPCKTQKS